MRGLPFALTSGPLLAQVIRDASDDPRRNTLCSFCGSRMRIKPDRTEQRARCPSCTRWQSVAVTDLIVTGPTETNVGDLQVLLVE